MSNTQCDRVKCVHNKMCNYLFELFDAQFTKVFDCNSYEEGRPHGEWLLIDEVDDPLDRLNRYKCSECGRIIRLWGNQTFSDYPFCHCGADMRGDT